MLRSMRWTWHTELAGLGAIALAAACGGGDVATLDGGAGLVDAWAPLAPDAALPSWPVGETIALQVDHGAFPPDGDRPNVLAYIPAGYHAGGALDVVVFLHGWYNCVETAVGAVNAACTAGGPPRNAYDIAGQLDASGRNAIVLAPELRVDQASSDPGALIDDAQFASLLADSLEQLAPIIGQDLPNLAHVIVASHSGGYWATSQILAVGGVAVDEVWLLDSLYGEFASFDGWLGNHEVGTAFTGTPPTMRFATIYTAGGGTLANSQAMADRAVPWLGDAMLDDRTTVTLTPDQYVVGGLFKRSALAHDDVPRYYVQQLLATSVLPSRPAP